MDFTIPNKLSNEIKGYCNANQINVQEFILKIIKKGFDLEKWGDINFVETPPETAIGTPPPQINSKSNEILKSPQQKSKTQFAEAQSNDDIYGDE